MKNIRTQLLTTAAMMTFGGGAYAADMGPPLKAPPPAPLPLPSWAGPYIGVNVGAARLNTTVDPSQRYSPCSYYNASSCSNGTTGVAAGVEVGYDWQSRYFVYGVAADWTWTGLSHTQNASNGSGTTFTSFQAKVDWLASFRGRAGLAVDDTLVYMTGGLALGHVKSSISIPTFNENYGSLDKVAVGWVAGVGVEHKFTPNWSGKVEFLYYDLGQVSTDATPFVGANSYHTEFIHEIMTARVGLQYRW